MEFYKYHGFISVCISTQRKIAHWNIGKVKIVIKYNIVIENLFKFINKTRLYYYEPTDDKRQKHKYYICWKYQTSTRFWTTWRKQKKTATETLSGIYFIT